MHTFIAKLVFQIICGAGNHRPQFDEQLRLIFAENTELAFESAVQIGEAEQSSFYNMNEQLVQWKFTGIAHLQLLGALEHGAEIYSGITEREEVERYVEHVKLRSEDIRERVVAAMTEEVDR